MPTNLPDLGIVVTEANIDEMAEKATHYGKKVLGRGSNALHKADVITILTNANKA